ncbi:MAG: type II secretion system F family protein [Phycisphaerales bacterium]
MATFQYEALDKSGKSKKGTIEAKSVEDAMTQLRMNGLYPSRQPWEAKTKKSAQASAAEQSAAASKKSGGGGLVLPFQKVKGKTLTTFTRQLSTLQDAGLPLLRSLQILEQQQRPGLLKGVLQAIVEDVQGGASLSEAMAKHPRAFDVLYTKMVAAGEIGGVLDVILQRLAEFKEKAQRLKRKVVGAMIYPAMVVAVAILIVTGIMYFIIPRFQEIFADFGVTLPAITVFLVDVSSWVAGNYPTEGAMLMPGAVYIMAFLVFCPIFYVLARKTTPGRAFFDWITLYIPIVGGLLRKTTVARFTRTLGTLIAAGVPILEAITITKETSGNYVFERALGKVHDSIREGETFAGPLRDAKVCDSIVVNMIDVGEETGDMDTMLLKIADNYDEEVDTAVSSLVSLIEPLLIVFLGGIVGTIVVAMFMPLVSMIEQLQSQ